MQQALIQGITQFPFAAGLRDQNDIKYVAIQRIYLVIFTIFTNIQSRNGVFVCK